MGGIKQAYNTLLRRLEEFEKFYLRNYIIIDSLPSYLTAAQQYELQAEMGRFRITPEPHEVQEVSGLSQQYFVTVTFDRKRFFRNTDVHTMNYIYYNLYKIIVKFYGRIVYGCFERHKDGWIHTHFVVSLTDDSLVSSMEMYIRCMFAENPRNHHCVKILRATNAAINYINKVDTPQKRGFAFYSEIRLPYTHDLEPEEINN